MRAIGIVLWTVLAAGCGSKTDPPVSQPGSMPGAEQQGPAAIQALSADVLILVELPSGRDFGTLPTLWARLDPEAPGQPDLVRANISRALDELMFSLLGIPADAADLKRPMRLVIVNPKKLDSLTPVVVVRIADPAKLDSSREDIQVEIRGEYALIGPASAVSLLTPKDIAILTVPAEVDEPEITLLVRGHIPIDRAFEKQIQRLFVGDRVRGVVDAAWLLVEECDRIIIRAHTQRGIGQISARVVFAEGSRLAEFAGMQPPTDHALLGKVPAGSANGLVVVGQLRAGPFYAALVDYLEAHARAEVSPAAAQHLRHVLGQLTGGLVIDAPLADESELPVILLLEAVDPDLVMHHSRAFAAEERDVQYTPRVFLHDGIAVDHEVDQEDLSTGGETMMAGFGRYFIAVYGRGVEATARATIDAARGKGKAFVPYALMKAALERSRARKDSLFSFAPIAGIDSFLEWQPQGVQAVALGLSFGSGDAVFTLEFLN